ncbi:DUF3373 family protein [Hydrogenimonas urashimensis]|uniref:DUF3373 family protein n=1 Tax=Hydrogenimonas urashimensis TaxID=2740515 RepID=UPI001916BC68|nr:DUF3373 family protein [Hydrogenimonas urashimensis]
MKKLIAMSTAAAIAATMSFAASDDDLRAELEALKKEVQALKKQTKGLKAKRLKKQISELKSAALNDNIKWNVDFRSAFDYIHYEYNDGSSDANQIFTNRLWLGMKYAPTQNLSFIGTLSYYKMYGQLPSPAMGFNYFDWVVNETPNDGTVRVKEAYFIYFGDKLFGANVPWTASIGRRPATDGLLVNYREDQNPKSPIGHIINTEFDGASFKFDLSNVTDIPGMYFKLCMGRGMTNANSRYAVQVDGVNYTKLDGWDHTDLAGFIFVPYDDGQYSVHTTWFRAFNLPGMYGTEYYYNGLTGAPIGPNPQTMEFKQGGDMDGAAISLLAEGIGDGINDFLDETNFFVSFAWSKTRPGGSHNASMIDVTGTNPTMDTLVDNAMLGSNDNETGNSIYVGTNFPVMFIDGGRIGLEYNHGSEYWRSFTYAEDTLAGSKLATRGDAYEIWYNQELIGKTLTAQVRYTYMDYDYTGSQGFFGEAGAPIDQSDAEAMGMVSVEKAQDLRVYVRYRY